MREDQRSVAPYRTPCVLGLFTVFGIRLRNLHPPGEL